MPASAVPYIPPFLLVGVFLKAVNIVKDFRATKDGSLTPHNNKAFSPARKCSRVILQGCRVAIWSRGFLMAQDRSGMIKVNLGSADCYAMMQLVSQCKNSLSELHYSDLLPQDWFKSTLPQYLLTWRRRPASPPQQPQPASKLKSQMLSTWHPWLCTIYDFCARRSMHVAREGSPLPPPFGRLWCDQNRRHGWLIELSAGRSLVDAKNRETLPVAVPRRGIGKRSID